MQRLIKLTINNNNWKNIIINYKNQFNVQIVKENLIKIELINIKISVKVKQKKQKNNIIF